jgi:hypothetical protein
LFCASANASRAASLELIFIIAVWLMDEKPVQLLSEIFPAINPAPSIIGPDGVILRHGRNKKKDAECKHEGTASIFLFTEPLGKWRRAVAREHRKAEDYAILMKELSDIYYPNAEKIIMVQDNLNIHSPSTFYQAFPPEEAFRLAHRFEYHYTPTHGSWLDIAECELSVLSRQCLGDLRIPKIAELNERLAYWEEDRNSRQVGVNWQFTEDDARIKLKRLYPEVKLKDK